MQFLKYVCIFLNIPKIYRLKRCICIPYKTDFNISIVRSSNAFAAGHQQQIMRASRFLYFSVFFGIVL